jgi:hypothetical protein
VNKLQLQFTDTNVMLSGCGTLVPGPHSYSVTRRGDSLVIQLANEPHPFAVVLGPNGAMTGPGMTAVTGQIITGYHHWTEYTRRVSDNQIVSERPMSEPIYAPKLEHCEVGALRSTGPVVGGSFMELLEAGLGADSSKLKTYPPGPRFTGTYASSGGLSAQFSPEGVVMDCGQAHVARTYKVENSAASLRLTIDNGSTPLALTMQSDGSLLGNGSADIAGRVVSGTAPNGDITFRPTHANCSIGTLTPRTQRTSAGM